MPLANFLWDDEVTERDGVAGLGGTARDEETGAIVPVFMPLDLFPDEDRPAS